MSKAAIPCQEKIPCIQSDQLDSKATFGNCSKELSFHNHSQKQTTTMGRFGSLHCGHIVKKYIKTHVINYSQHSFTKQSVVLVNSRFICKFVFGPLIGSVRFTFRIVYLNVLALVLKIQLKYYSANIFHRWSLKQFLSLQWVISRLRSKRQGSILTIIFTYFADRGIIMI